MHDSQFLRALTYQLHLYDISVKMYISITALIEISASGFWMGSKFEIIPFFIPFSQDDGITVLENLLGFRIFALIWLIANTMKTLLKKDTMNEVFSLQTLIDVCWSLTLIGLQITVISHYFAQHNFFPISSPSEIDDEQIRTKRLLLRNFGYRHWQILFLDSISLCVVVINLMTLLSHTEIVGKLLKALILALSILVRGLIVWILYNCGLSFNLMALYGYRDERYHTFLSSYIYSFYGQLAFSYQKEEQYLLEDFFFYLLNNLFMYFMIILLMGISLISLYGEYRSELLLYSPPEYTSTTSK